uniref:ABC transporter permease n=1 Tax=uncultured Allobacillus sp. TaxID=1638025 RepID=UPI00259AC645|nr:ABC transporter permease [uncultured Allobacillus sp.]
MLIIWKSIFKRITTWVLMVLIPIVLGIIIYPIIKDTVSQVSVPITVVDQTNQAITEELLKEIEDSPFQVTKTESLDLHLLSTGEAEAIFVFNDELEANILSGNTDKIVTWYRTENSYVDGLFKEKLASAIMSRVVRAEAASIVSHYRPETEWDEVFKYGLKYFDPRPIFEMKFEHIHGAQNTSSIDSGNQLLFIIMWLYLSMLIGYFTKILYEWRTDGILERLKLLQQTQYYYWSWFIGVLAIIYSFSFVAIQLIEVPLNNWAYFIPFGTVLIYFLFFILVKKKWSMYAWLISYSVASFIIFLLADWQIIESEWMYLFIPTWLLG